MPQSIELCIMRRLQYIPALIQICPILLLDSYVIFPQTFGRNRRESNQRISSAECDGENERDLSSHIVGSQRSSKFDSAIDDCLIPTSKGCESTMATTRFDRKLFIEVLAAASGAVFDLR